MNELYLDNASTTKPSDSILNAIMPYIEEHWHNPSSLYSNGVKVRNDIESVRKQVANLINAKPEEIYFTSGAAEANNWAIRGYDDKCCAGQIITTPIEHASIIKMIEKSHLQSNIKIADIDQYGVVKLDSLVPYNKYKSNLTSVIAANNEIGTVQNLKDISDKVHSYNGVFHTDATQMLPYMQIDVEKMGIDMLSASAQKLGGLKGAGFLYVKNSVKDMIEPLIYGEQERGMRGGTENVVGIIAMGEAIKYIDHDNISYMHNLQECFIGKLESIGCKLIGSKENRLPNHISIMLPDNVGGEELLYILDMSGIMISTGSACNSHSKEASHVLKAIGLTDEEASRVIRITFSSNLTMDDVYRTVGEIEKAIKLTTLYSGSV